MQSILNPHLSSYQAGEVQSCPGLAILPLFRKEAAEHIYLSLHQALRQGSLVISEISEGGSVPSLKVLNRGKIPVLLLDGEELRGAKQNRVLNTSVLVAGESDLVIPVSCTESGRWQYQGKTFEESGNVMSPSIRSGKMESVSESLKIGHEYRSDQGRVWNDIDQLHSDHGSHSQTSAMADVFSARASQLEEMLEAFPLLEGQCGIWTQMRDAFGGMDLVSLPSCWKDVHAKIIRSYALDVLRQPQTEYIPGQQTFEEFLALLEQSKVSSFSAVGLGTELRLEQESLIGSALLWENSLAHLAAYPRHSASGHEERYHSPRHR